MIVSLGLLHAFIQSFVLQYLILSMVTYALFEVSAKKWLVPAGDTAPLANSVRGLGMMGVHTLVWMW